MKNKKSKFRILLISAGIIMATACSDPKIEDENLQTESNFMANTTAAVGRTIHVSAIFGDDASTNPFSSSTPYATLKKAASITLPGDVVLVMNGTYTPPTTANTNDIILDISRSGTAENYITYKNFPGASPLLFTSGKKWNTININASYIIIDGLELKGNNAAISLTAAKAAEIDHRAGGGNWDDYSQYNTNGISIKGPNNPHHVEIRNCKVHDFPGGGISGENADYLTIANNISYNNCWFTYYGTSGISILAPINTDMSTAYKMKIVRNISHDNYTQVPYAGSATSGLSDGNGIIIDVNNGLNGTVNYTGRTLVENNICYKNGGGGVHAFKAQHVDVLNNTTFANEQKLAYANIDANQCNDIVFRNNIAYSKTGGKANNVYASTNVSFDYNLYYNGTVVSGGTHSVNANPNFVDITNRNFNLQSGSPAINTGMTTSISGTSMDFIYNPRIKNGIIDCGAYEVN